MRKFFVLACVIASFFFAAAFRLITSYRVSKAADPKVIVGLKKLSAISCRIAPDAFGDAPDIPPLTGWGPHRWKITTRSDSTQFYFDQGINMYYAFHTLEARASFAKALRFDSTCAMAYYGKALALGPTINYGNGYRAGLAAFQAAETGRKYEEVCTPLEKGLIEAIGTRYSSDTSADLKKLQEHYSSTMKAMAAAYPQNADIVALYGDALMLEHPWDLYDAALQPRPWTPEIRRVLASALAIDSLHPGALHFMIHTVEGSLHPEDGVKSAESLAGLMPDVAHVVHMPSHIYIRSGDYRKGIDVNEKAVSGYNKYLGLYAPVAEDAGLYQLHAVHMKIACAMMAGNLGNAMAGADALRAVVPQAALGSFPGGLGNFIQYAYQFRLFTLIRFGKWVEILEEAKMDTAIVYASLIDHFARGMAFSHLGKYAEADQALKMVQKELQDSALKLSYDPFSTAREAGLIAESLLTGVLAEKRLNYKAARDAFQKAVAAEDALIYDEPRDWPIPARQYLGDLLLKTGEYKEAIKVFGRDLQINPTNGWSLTGLQLAYKALNDKQGMARTSAGLSRAWQIRDQPVERPVF